MCRNYYFDTINKSKRTPESQNVGTHCHLIQRLK